MESGDTDTAGHLSSIRQFARKKPAKLANMLMKTSQNQWLIFLKSFCFLFPALLLSAIGLFYFVRSVFRGVFFGWDDSPIWIMFGYRWANFTEIVAAPVFYLLSISFISALLGAFWRAFIVRGYSKFLFLQILMVPWLAVILTGPVWGLIWSVNHWPAQGFASYETMMLFRRTDMDTGLSLSWLSAAQSYPLNIFSYAVFCGLLLINKRFFQGNKEQSG